MSVYDFRWRLVRRLDQHDAAKKIHAAIGTVVHRIEQIGQQLLHLLLFPGVGALIWRNLEGIFIAKNMTDRAFARFDRVQLCGHGVTRTLVERRHYKLRVEYAIR